MNFGLDDDTLNLIKEKLNLISNIEAAILYGSRAMGNEKPGSDIDIVLKGKNLDINDVFEFEKSLDELLLPYLFDIVIYHQINNTNLISHINRVGCNIFSRQ